MKLYKIIFLLLILNSLFIVNNASTYFSESEKSSLHVRLKSISYNPTQCDFIEKKCSQFDFSFLIEIWNPFDAIRSIGHLNLIPLFSIELTHDTNYTIEFAHVIAPAITTKLYMPGTEEITIERDFIIEEYIGTELPNGNYSIRITGPPNTVEGNTIRYYNTTIIMNDGIKEFANDSIPENWGQNDPKATQFGMFIAFISLVFLMILRKYRRNNLL